tara:strand:- start:328 stop:498 length:171 start_codon:yes stop_codon:yes gene_type:complete
LSAVVDSIVVIANEPPADNPVPISQSKLHAVSSCSATHVDGSEKSSEKIQSEPDLD